MDTLLSIYARYQITRHHELRTRRSPPHLWNRVNRLKCKPVGIRCSILPRNQRRWILGVGLNFNFFIKNQILPLGFSRGKYFIDLWLFRTSFVLLEGFNSATCGWNLHPSWFSEADSYSSILFFFQIFVSRHQKWLGIFNLLKRYFNSETVDFRIEKPFKD